MSTLLSHSSPRQNVQFAHRAALLTATLVGVTLLGLQVLSGTNPLAHFFRLAQLVGALYLVVFLLGVLARSTWGDLAPQGYGRLLYQQTPNPWHLAVSIPRFVAQISQTLLLPLTVRLRYGFLLCPSHRYRCADGTLSVYKTSRPFRLFGQAPLRLPW